jgi:protein O-GlcNAc transferase
MWVRSCAVNLELENKLSEGLAHCNQKAWAEAAQAFEAALLLDPDHAITWNNLGNVRDELGDNAGSMAAYFEALRLEPGYVNAKTNLTNIAHKYGVQAYGKADLGEALRLFEVAALNAPASNADFDHSYLQLLLETCTHSKVQQHMAAMQVHTKASAAYALHPYPLLAACDDPAWHMEAARRHALRLGRDAGVPVMRTTHPTTHPRELPQGRRIRIAYLSSDWHQHPVPQQLLAVIEAHDRTRFELIGVATDSQVDNSPWRQRIERAFEHFYMLGHLNDSAIADQLRGMDIDIAIDLSLYMENGRPLILASRPCSKQVAFLGYAGTSGAPWLDYLIADEVSIPLSHEALYSESIIRLVGASFMPDNNQRPQVVTPTDRAAERLEQGLPAHAFVFCAFSNPYKITPSLLACWFTILHSVPHSVLWLQANNDIAQHNLEAAAIAAGLEPKRVIFAKRMTSFAAHLQRYALADLFLDTCPYNAHVTAADALWAGLPVLTLQGESFASRVASSILTALDLPELITQCESQYETLALTLASQPVRLNRLTRDLQRSIQTSNYFDQTAYARGLEQVYLQIKPSFNSASL